MLYSYILYNMSSKELKFIHITKCAGTYIEDIGKSHNLEWGRFHKEYGFWHRLFGNVPAPIRYKYDWFMIVRNPYDRILSEYYCQWGGIGKTNIKHTKLEFNSYLIHKIQKRNLKGGHYTEQYKYLVPDVSIHVVKLEDLKEQLSALFEKYALDIKLSETFANTKESKNRVLPFTVSDFSPKLIQLINKVYQQDFKLFQYPMKSE